jgi:hypothetical protein
MNSLILEPATSEDLFRIALDRLADIAHHVSHGDFSVRQAFAGSAQRPVTEEPVQNFLAHELDMRRRSQYDVVREPEVTRKARPDIRLLNPRCSGPVTIEVKIAERWTREELEAGLREQLVGTYMRANGSNHGVFALCSSGRRKWRLAGGEEVAFQQLVEHLAVVASQAVRDTPGVFDLRVVAIDFH